MAFSFLWGGEHVFVHVVTAASRGGLREGLKGVVLGMNSIFFVFNSRKRLRVAFSFLWGGKHVFVHFFTA